MLKEHDICTMADCGRPHKARGYCQTHYMQFLRGVTPVGPIRSRVREKPLECAEEGCGGPVKAQGLCKMHYQRKLRHGHVNRPDRKKAAQGVRRRDLRQPFIRQGSVPRALSQAAQVGRRRC